MRNLTKKQKKMLDVYVVSQLKKGKNFGLIYNCDEDEDFTSELYVKIENINPSEVFYQNVNRYISDKVNDYEFNR